MDYNRYIEFEHSLRYLLMDINGGIDKQDLTLLEEIKQSIIVFTMKDKFNESNTIFLNNMKNDFYRNIALLEEKHSDIKRQVRIIKSFMEDFYFNTEK